MCHGFVSSVASENSAAELQSIRGVENAPHRHIKEMTAIKKFSRAIVSAVACKMKVQQFIGSVPAQ